jgi:hypothetical protein
LGFYSVGSNSQTPTQGEVDGFFRDPDTFGMYMQVETQSATGPPIQSPVLFVGFNVWDRDDGDAPTWLELIVGEQYSFAQPREFMAEVFLWTF